MAEGNDLQLMVAGKVEMKKQKLSHVVLSELNKAMLVKCRAYCSY